MIVTEIVSICRRLIWDTSLTCRSRSPTVTIIWKPCLSIIIAKKERKENVALRFARFCRFLKGALLH